MLVLLFALVLASLMTPLERKVLGSGQRRSGPSYCGWWGLVQLVADGVKLFYKWLWVWSSTLGLVGAGIGVGGAFVAVLVLVSTLLGHELLSTELGTVPGLACASWLWQLLWLGVSHLACVGVGFALRSPWSIYGSLRAALVLCACDIGQVLLFMSFGVAAAGG